MTFRTDPFATLDPAGREHAPTVTWRRGGARSDGDAVHVRRIAGGAGIRPVTGRVDIASVAHLRHGGEPAGALAPLPASTTLREVLGLVAAVGDDARGVPGRRVLAPSVLLAAGSV